MSSFMKAASVQGLPFVALFGLTAGAMSQEPGVPALPYEGTSNYAETLGQVDIGLILRTWKAKGIGFCYNGFELRVCLWVENAFPSGVFEVVRQPGRTHYPEWKGVLEALVPLGGLGRSSNHMPVAGDGTGNHFAEARAYTFVPPVALEATEIPIAKPWGAPWQLDYVTELDAFAWRSPVVDEVTSPRTHLARLKSCDRIPDLSTCAMRWGSYYPRIGFINNPSQVMAAYMQALRAGRAASRPLGRAVLAPYPFEPRTGHWIQMLKPQYRPPVSIGFPVTKLLERGTRSPWGAYTFLHYGIFTECRRCTPVLLMPPRPPSL